MSNQAIPTQKQDLQQHQNSVGKNEKIEIPPFPSVRFEKGQGFSKFVTKI